MKLSAKPHNDLNWQIEGNPDVFEFDLGLDEPYFPLEDELHFQALSFALAHFTKQIWPQFPDSRAILYRGNADFSTFFRWTERQEENFAIWKKEKPEHDTAHLKRLFCAEAFITYFQMLAHKLPDEMPITLILDTQNTGTLAQTLHLLSPERFEHFHVDAGLRFESNRGICFPVDERCSRDVLERINAELVGSFRPVYESHLTEQWDGLDEIWVADPLTPQGKRKLLGFIAAGGEIRGRGI